jgi:hypothetical protein
MVAQLVEDHIRQVGHHCVYLEKMNPRWLYDGRLVIGSDYQQVFSHVEVQTYQ